MEDVLTRWPGETTWAQEGEALLGVTNWSNKKFLFLE
jgi:hypothetical protein